MKINKIIFLVVVILLGTTVSCSSDENEDTSNNKEINFEVKGSISEANNIPLYLEAMSQNGSIKVSETTVSSDGTFELKGNIPGMGIYQLRLGEGVDKVIPLTLSPKEKIQMKTSFADFAFRPNFSGAPWTTPMNTYMSKYSVFLTGQMELNNSRSQLSEDQLMLRYMELRKPIDDFAIKQMDSDPGNPINIILSSSAAPNTGFENWNPKNLKILQKVAKAFKMKYAGSPISSTMENQVFQIESAYKEYQTSKSTGTVTQKAPEIRMKDPTGKIRTLSSLKGKIVLIDFWASWCGPCRRENPSLVKLYKQYKDKEFTVFSVSLDNNIQAWKQAISQDGLIWPDHVSDLKGWDTPMTELYGFNSIPNTVLIDKEGNIVATGLRGASLEQKLKELISG